MHYRLNDILAFLRVMESGSISTAAQRMGLSKSVISKRIADLETGLKVEFHARGGADGQGGGVLSTGALDHAPA